MGYNIANIPVDLILNILNVIIFVVVVRALVYKPVKKFINERKAKINADIDDAARAKAETESLRSEYESRLADSKSDAERIVSGSREEAKKVSEKIVSDAEDEGRRIIDEARTKAGREKEKIMSSVQDEIVSASAMMAEKLLQRSVTDEDTRKIAEDFFASQSSENRK